jgi:hypothetical protein
MHLSGYSKSKDLDYTHPVAFLLAPKRARIRVFWSIGPCIILLPVDHYPEVLSPGPIDLVLLAICAVLEGSTPDHMSPFSSEVCEELLRQLVMFCILC